MSMGGYVAVKLTQLIELGAVVMIAPAMYDAEAFDVPSAHPSPRSSEEARVGGGAMPGKSFETMRGACSLSLVRTMNGYRPT